MGKRASGRRRGNDDAVAKEKIELVAVTPEISTKEVLLALVEMLQKRGIKVIPAKNGSLLDEDGTSERQ